MERRRSCEHVWVGVPEFGCVRWNKGEVAAVEGCMDEREDDECVPMSCGGPVGSNYSCRETTSCVQSVNERHRVLLLLAPLVRHPLAGLIQVNERKSGTRAPRSPNRSHRRALLCRRLATRRRLLLPEQSSLFKQYRHFLPSPAQLPRASPTKPHYTRKRQRFVRRANQLRCNLSQHHQFLPSPTTSARGRFVN